MENKNGQGIFYGVIGVATLIVAIIGATFAYFSASVSGNGANIEGSTLDVAGNNLTLQVTRVLPSTAPTSGDALVPADMTEDSTGYAAALSNGCVNSGYTGCHLYSIAAGTSTDLSSATITLSIGTSAAATTNWKYVVYDGTASSITTILTGSGSTANVMGTTSSPSSFTIQNGTALTTSGKTYYLLVYLHNTEGSQNGVGDGAENATGSYSGSVTLNAAGGQVKATFTA